MSKLRWYLHKFDLSSARDFDVPAEIFDVQTSGGLMLNGSRLPGKTGKNYLIVHGLTAHHRAPGYRELAHSLTRYGDVYSIDLRGHGLSDGTCTLANEEAEDVAAALSEIKRRSHHRTVLIGFSMGGASAIRAAALHCKPDAVVAVGSPSRWSGELGPGARRTRLIWRVPGGRLALRAATGVRIRAGWVECDAPEDVIHLISPAPVLLVHGTNDDFFPTEEAHRLFEAASEPKALWLVEGGGHSEGLFVDMGKPVDQSVVDSFADELIARLQAIWPR